MLQLSDVKSYLEIDFDNDDVLLNTLITATKDFIESHLNRPIDPNNMTDENKWTVPSQIQIAQMMLIHHWYKNRDILTERTREMPFGISAILGPHRFMGMC
ncbi:head-tail connector protein [Bacillus sp. RG28]|uniref:Head-tail connector protein n=1 Tax=Gottfriedia endophytica TaxID=2820819 RepID=A0A940SK23_9BACI|nr:head-tail connector protein [Gottfriedia endophytica]MBP0725539.1 head-tail connector protein [Gottfriedia endophytica]